MECQAITNKGKQCSRKAELGSLYCWQHQNYIVKQKENILQIPKLEHKANNANNSLLLKALQPEIISNIKNYAGILGDFSKIFNENTNKHQILKAWFQEINVQTPFEEVTDKDIKLLWPLYLKRISNAPPKDLLEKAIKQGLNPYLFYARIFEYKDEIPKIYINKYSEFKEPNSELLLYLNTILSKFTKDNGVRRGDMIILESIYYERPLLIFDGKNYDFIGNNIYIKDYELYQKFLKLMISQSLIIFKILIYLRLYILIR